MCMYLQLWSVWHNACAPCWRILISCTAQCPSQATGGREGNRFKSHNLLAVRGSHMAAFLTQWSVRVPPVARVLEQIHHRKPVSLSHIYLWLYECFNIADLYNVTPCVLADRGNVFFGDRLFFLFILKAEAPVSSKFWCLTTGNMASLPRKR
jgi:hypothetical protein